jgi:hypothetical protein
MRDADDQASALEIDTPRKARWTRVAGWALLVQSCVLVLVFLLTPGPDRPWTGLGMAFLLSALGLPLARGRPLGEASLPLLTLVGVAHLMRDAATLALLPLWYMVIPGLWTVVCAAVLLPARQVPLRGFAILAAGFVVMVSAAFGRAMWPAEVEPGIRLHLQFWMATVVPYALYCIRRLTQAARTPKLPAAGVAMQRTS